MSQENPQQRVSLEAQQQQSRNTEPGETGYVPPTSAVPLPSKGLVYPPESSLHRAICVDIRAMTARDEDILTSQALLTQGKAIGALLKSCVCDKSIDVDELLVGDRNAIMMAIRISGYGAQYKARVVCPDCETRFETDFDLNQLPIKQLGAEPLAVGSNVFSYTLPVSGKEVTFRLMTGAIEREMQQTRAAAKKAGVAQVEGSVTSALFYSLLSVGKETDRAAINRIVQNLPANDSRSLRQYIASISPGVDMVQTITCPQCGSQPEVDVPLGTEFFWPSGGR